MTCYLCDQQIEPQATINWHHYESLKSEGGKLITPTYQRCHVEYHSSNGQFKQWGRLGGKQSALTLRWSLNLLNIRTHPGYESARQTYLTNYANAGWGEGLI